MLSSSYHSWASQVAHDPWLGSMVFPSGVQAGFLFIQTEIGTPTPPPFGFGTTSAAPEGGNMFFVVNGTAGAWPPAAPPKLETCSRITASDSQAVPSLHAASARDRSVIIKRLPSNSGSGLQLTGSTASGLGSTTSLPPGNNSVVLTRTERDPACDQ